MDSIYLVGGVGVVVAYVIYQKLNSPAIKKEVHPPAKYPYQSSRVAIQDEGRQEVVSTTKEIDHHLGLPKEYRHKPNGTKVPIYKHPLTPINPSLHTIQHTK